MIYHKTLSEKKNINLLVLMIFIQKYSGPNNIHPKAFKETAPVISEPLQFIFNGDHFAICDIFALYYHFVNDDSPSLSPFYNISLFWKNLAHFSPVYFHKQARRNEKNTRGIGPLLKNVGQLG